MSISVKSNIDKVAAQFRRNAQEIRPAAARALNRVGEQARTQTSRGLREDGYNLKAGEIKAAMQLIKASAASLRVKLRVGRKPKSLMDYSPRETKAGVVVKIKGQAKLIKGAFIAQLRNGSSGVFVEDRSAGKVILRRQAQVKRGGKGGWQSFPCRKLYGPSVGGAFVNQRFQSELTSFVKERFEERLHHEVKRMFR